MTDQSRSRKYWTIAIIFFIAVLLFLSFDVKKYREYHARNPLVTGEQKYLSDVTIKKSPGSESWLIEKINASTNRVWIGIYMFTVPGIRDALLRSQERGVDVRIILEKFPY